MSTTRYPKRRRNRTTSSTTTTTTTASAGPPPPPDGAATSSLSSSFSEYAASKWKVIRLGSKNKEQRKLEGKKPLQKKMSCDELSILENGVEGKVRKKKRSGWFGTFGLGGSSHETIKDYNHYRSTVLKGPNNTNQRAVSICTLESYEILRKALPDSAAKIENGDMGENILLESILPEGSADSANSEGPKKLFVGAKIRVGKTAILEITEVCDPCYRFNYQSWAHAAKEKWGKSAHNANCWYESPKCPLNHHVFPGIRGWLAMVLQEGHVKLNDNVYIDTTVVKEDEDETVPSPRRKRPRRNLRG